MRAAWIAIALVACGGGQTEPKPVTNVVARPPADAAVDAPRDAVAAALAKMTEFTDRMCQCKDEPCTRVITDEMTAWSETMAKDDKTRAQIRPTEDQVKQMAAITERFASCMTKAMTPPNAGSASP